eukprot:scaffold204176_cov24-Attheya_sp.AAC.1
MRIQARRSELRSPEQRFGCVGCPLVYHRFEFVYVLVVMKSWENGGSSSLLSSVWSIIIMAVLLEVPEFVVVVLCTLGGGSMLVEVVGDSRNWSCPSRGYPKWVVPAQFRWASFAWMCVRNS